MSTAAVMPESVPRPLAPADYYGTFTGPESWRRSLEEPLPPVEKQSPELPRRSRLGPPEEPEWPKTFRGEVAKLIFRRGEVIATLAEDLTDLERRRRRQQVGWRLQYKALRFLICNKCARPARCNLHPGHHKYFAPNGCQVVFCDECADQLRRELFMAYQRVILAAIAKLGGIPKGWTLARVTVTLRSDGREITPERVKAFNAAVRALFRKIAGREYGCLFADEVGFETRGHLPDHLRKTHGLNLHAHGLYLGPFIRWEKWKEEWKGITRRRFGEAGESFGIYLTAVKVRRGEDGKPNVEGAVRWALCHMLKYVSKPPAVSPERLVSLICAFHTAKRIHALGSFAGKKERLPKRDIPCPKCRTLGGSGVLCFEGRALPSGGIIPVLRSVNDLMAEGYVLLGSYRAFDEATSAIGEGEGPP